MKLTETLLQNRLAAFFDYRKNLIVPNVSHAFFSHECDLLILTKAGYAIEVEIKVSAADLKKDFQKSKHKKPRPAKLSRLYYCVPEKLRDLAKEVVPAQYGIVLAILPDDVDGLITFHIERPAKKERGASPWSDRDVMALLRNLSLKYWSHRNNGWK